MEMLTFLEQESKALAWEEEKEGREFRISGQKGLCP